MGLVTSCLTCKSRTDKLESFHEKLHTGDVVWLQKRGSEVKQFMFKYRVWRSFSHVGFLIRSGPGIEGLMLCIPKLPPSHAGSPREITAGGQGALVALYPLTQEITADNKRLAITQLLAQMTPSAMRAARDMAQAAGLRQLDGRVAVHLSKTAKVFVTELVAVMLGATQLAGSDYYTLARMTLLPPHYVRLPRHLPSSSLRLLGQGVVYKDCDAGSDSVDSYTTPAGKCWPRKLALELHDAPASAVGAGTADGAQAGWAAQAPGADTMPRQCSSSKEACNTSNEVPQV